jgi:hypothetical protein
MKRKRTHISRSKLAVLWRYKVAPLSDGKERLKES